MGFSSSSFFAPALKSFCPDKIQIQFVTQLGYPFVVPNTPFEVPAKFSRLGLSEVVNHLLALPAPVPFDFLINGEVSVIEMALPYVFSLVFLCGVS